MFRKRGKKIKKKERKKQIRRGHGLRHDRHTTADSRQSKKCQIIFHQLKGPLFFFSNFELPPVATAI